MSELTIRPLDRELWPEFEALFGANGACAGCWCMWWRLRRSEFQAGSGNGNKAAFKRIVQKGPPPGLLAFDGDEAVGWCQLTPSSALPTLGRSPMLKPVDEVPVWSVSCFYVKRGRRGQGVMSALIEAALHFAEHAGAPALEAYPWETSEKKANATVYTGVLGAFTREGFKVIARRAPHRPIVRHDLKKIRTRIKSR